MRVPDLFADEVSHPMGHFRHRYFVLHRHSKPTSTSDYIVDVSRNSSNGEDKDEDKVNCNDDDNEPGNDTDSAISHTFFDALTTNHSYSTGGSNSGECWQDARDLGAFLDSQVCLRVTS